MIKAFIIIISSLVSVSIAQAYICFPAGITQDTVHAIIQEKWRAGHLEFAFDIHNTLCQKNKTELQKRSFSHPRKLALLSTLFNFPLLAEGGYFTWHAILKKLAHLDPWLLFDELSAERFLAIFEYTKATELQRFIAYIYNAQHVKPGMIELVQQLKAKGHTLRVASNMLIDSFIALKETLSEQNMNIFDFFNKDHRGLEGKVTEPRGIAFSPHKPNPAYYQEYINTYDPKREKLFILIDDKDPNVAEATNQGMIGIKFKSAKQLLIAFIDLGVL